MGGSRKGKKHAPNEARGANVFWIVEGAVSMGASSHMEETILGGAAIALGVTTTMSGRALAGTPVGTVAFSSTVSEVTGSPPLGFPPPVVVAETVTDANGNKLFEGVPPGTFFVSWDLSGITTDFRTTTAKQGGDVGVSVDGLEFEIFAGTTHHSVDLGLVETLVFTTTPDLLITLQSTTELTDPASWTTIATATPETNVRTFVHDAELATGARRFYRAFLIH